MFKERPKSNRPGPSSSQSRSAEATAKRSASSAGLGRVQRGNAAAIVDAEASAAELLSRHRVALERLDSRELVSLNTAVEDCVTKTFRAADELRTFLPALRELTGFDFELVAALADWAIILNDTHAAVLALGRPTSPRAASLSEGRALRRLLHADAEALVARGILEQRALRVLKGSVGHLKLAHDLRVLAELFTSKSAAADGRCAVNAHEIARARQLADEISRAAALRNEPIGAADKELRKRAFTMLSRAYCEARDGVRFLRRREGDVDRILPPLVNGRPSRRRRSEQLRAAGQQRVARKSPAQD
jgi:hypothetical protein